MLYRITLVLLVTLLSSLHSSAQFPAAKNSFTQADTLRGSITPLRSCYDIYFYHLDVKFDIENKYVSGSNTFKFKATTDFNQLQIDLFQNLQINKIIYKGNKVNYKRLHNAVFITFPTQIRKGSKDEFTVFYEGKPAEAKRAPMESGIVYAKDAEGKPLVSTACESQGASIWWPNKDHLADEVDSMLISVTVPSHLKEVSNGRLRKVTDMKNGYTRFDWFVDSPINNYNVAVNIGNYAHIKDEFKGKAGKLTLDYWVLPYNLSKAKIDFDKNVKLMLSTYEYWFGKYPFYKDGYKLVETPYPAMEHQTAISYGGYLPGGPKNELVDPSSGKSWDFIIVHESAHEWFGNSITAKDLADLWIHEGFASYAESLFIESQSGKTAGQTYLLNNRKGISNSAPIVAAYNVNQLGSGDMYSKGAALINMVRTLINDDTKWRNILHALNERFYHQTVSYKNVVDFFSQKSGYNLKPIFNQYLLYKNLPVLELKTINGSLNCRWIADEADFNLPVMINTADGKTQTLHPVTSYSPVNIAGLTEENIVFDRSNYYFKLSSEL